MQIVFSQKLTSRSAVASSAIWLSPKPLPFSRTSTCGSSSGAALLPEEILLPRCARVSISRS